MSPRWRPPAALHAGLLWLLSGQGCFDFEVSGWGDEDPGSSSASECEEGEVECRPAPGLLGLVASGRYVCAGGRWRALGGCEESDGATAPEPALDAAVAYHPSAEAVTECDTPAVVIRLNGDEVTVVEPEIDREMPLGDGHLSFNLVGAGADHQSQACGDGAAAEDLVIGLELLANATLQVASEVACDDGQGSAGSTRLLASLAGGTWFLILDGRLPGDHGQALVRVVLLPD